MTQTNVDSRVNNVNLGLNYITIDDLIWRAIFLSEPYVRRMTKAQREQAYRNEWGMKYGREVFGSKVVLVRSDINEPYDEANISIKGDLRIRASVPTIDEISGYGAKVVVMAHQGTSAAKDCIHLDPHKERLEALLGREVIFKREHYSGAATMEIIKDRMNEGDILLLDNLRQLAVEALSSAKSPGEFVQLPHTYMKTLESLAAFLVNDAFPANHRPHGSIIGFPNLMNIAGRFTMQELEKIRRLTGDITPPYTLLLGGLKVAGYIEFMEDSLKNDLVDYILAAGILGVMSYHGLRRERKHKKIDFGNKTDKFLWDEGLYPLIKQVQALARNDNRIIVPLDFKVEDASGNTFYMTPEQLSEHPEKDTLSVYGIGPITVALFIDKISESKTIYAKGSPTKDSDQESKQLFDAIVEARSNGAITILSGGDTNARLEEHGYSAQHDFTHFTLAGGAAAEYMAGNLLPGLLMLDLSHREFWRIKEDPILPPGYNPKVWLIRPNIPENLRPFRR